MEQRKAEKSDSAPAGLGNEYLAPSAHQEGQVSGKGAGTLYGA